MEKKKNFIINVMFYGMMGGIILVACKVLLPVLFPFLLAFLAAVVIHALADKISKGDEKKRKICAVLFCILFYMAFFSVVFLAGGKIVKTVVNVAASAPAIYNEKIMPLFLELSDWLERTFFMADSGMSQEIEAMFLNLSQSMGQFISDFSVKGVKWISGGVAGIPGFVVKLVITVVATFFMASDFPQIMGFFMRMVPEKKREYITQGKNYIYDVVFIYIRSYSLLFLLTFLELCIGLFILRIPHAGLAALAIAVFDILPVLGTGGILLPWSVILLLLGNKILAAGMLVLYLVITVVRNIVEPRLVGKQIGLHPLATLLAMFMGLKILGIVGMVLFPMMSAVFVNIGRVKRHSNETG